MPKRIIEYLPMDETITNQTIPELIKKLKHEGFDGLYAPEACGECACLFTDVGPCGQICFDCVPGYNRPDDPANTEGTEIYITHIPK